ncbi:hypothetical protein P9112_007046 [Eukaryota sp. TZLM1-RC]
MISFGRKVANAIGFGSGSSSSNRAKDLHHLRNEFKRYDIHNQIESIYDKNDQDITETRLALKRMISSRTNTNQHSQPAVKYENLQYDKQSLHEPPQLTSRSTPYSSYSVTHSAVQPTQSRNTPKNDVREGDLQHLHDLFPHVPMSEITKIYDKHKGDRLQAASELTNWSKPQGTNKVKPMTKDQKKAFTLLRKEFSQMKDHEIEKHFREHNFNAQTTRATLRALLSSQQSATTKPSRPLPSPHHTQQPTKHEEEEYWDLMHNEPAEAPIKPLSEVPLNVLVELRNDLVKAMNSIPVNCQLNGDKQKARRELLEEFNHHLNELRTAYNSRISSVIDVSNCSPEEFISLISSLAKTPKQIAIEFFFGDQTPQQFAEILHHKEINYCINGFSNSFVVQF